MTAILRFAAATAFFALAAPLLWAASADEDFAALIAIQAAIKQPPASQQEMGAGNYFRWVDEAFQKAGAAALAFYERHPNDPRRWDAVLMAASRTPLFISSIGPDVE